MPCPCKQRGPKPYWNRLRCIYNTFDFRQWRRWNHLLWCPASRRPQSLHGLHWGPMLASKHASIKHAQTQQSSLTNTSALCILYLMALAVGCKTCRCGHVGRGPGCFSTVAQTSSSKWFSGTVAWNFNPPGRITSDATHGDTWLKTKERN